MTIDTTKDQRKYFEFYEEIGRKYPESKIVHANKSITSRFYAVISELQPYAAQGKIMLDVGCNDGVYTIPYALMGGCVHGIDISPSLINQAQKKAEHLKLKNISFEVADIQNFSSSRKYDLVLMSEVLEHLLDPDSAILNIKKCLKFKGTFILTAPTPFFEYYNFKDVFFYTKRLFQRRLNEKYLVKSDNVIPAKYGIKSYLYRHDNYYPLGLLDYIQKFGFKRIRYYTIRFSHITRIAKKKPVELTLRKIPLINLFGQTNIMIFQNYQPKILING